ncbi:MAG TPA: NPCBM/NEW2 domain-containing protein, partial [Planctomycetota bacterium]|nr:NPCBM/NEW2 domain-containing protein [Planctomycetota bacterium]
VPRSPAGERMTRTPRARLAAASAVLALVAAASLAAPARADVVRTLDGESAGEVASIEGDGDALVVKTAGRAIPVAEVKEVVFPAAERETRPGPVRLFLTTGDELTGDVVAGDEDKVSLRSASLGTLDVRLDLIRAVALTSDEADLRRFRKEIVPSTEKGDLVVTRSWTTQTGRLERIDARGISFDFPGGLGKVTLGAEKVIGARLEPLGKPPQPPPGLRARLDLADGSILFGKLRGYAGGVFTLDSALKAGLAVKSRDVRSLSFLGGRIVYLSDLEPTATDEHAKDISLVFKHREDASVMGNPLRLDGKTYRKGIGVHAYSKLAYDLDGRYARLHAVIGLDDEAREMRGATGTIRFQVLVDGKPALGEHGLALSTRDPARPIDIDVAGAKTVELVADFGESLDTLSRGGWADAYLVKK